MKEQNPVEEEKAAPGINVKQMVAIGAITAATGTVVGAVVMELYRYMRPKIPIPQTPRPQLGAMQQNPALPWAPQGPWGQPMGALPPAQPYPAQAPAPNPMPPQPGYHVEALQAAPYTPQNRYAPQPALPQAPPAPHEIVPTIAPAREPLSLTQLAQWQHGLESWERRLDDRDNES